MSGVPGLARHGPGTKAWSLATVKVTFGSISIVFQTGLGRARWISRVFLPG